MACTGRIKPKDPSRQDYTSQDIGNVAVHQRRASRSSADRAEHLGQADEAQEQAGNAVCFVISSISIAGVSPRQTEKRAGTAPERSTARASRPVSAAAGCHRFSQRAISYFSHYFFLHVDPLRPSGLWQSDPAVLNPFASSVLHFERPGWPMAECVSTICACSDPYSQTGPAEWL